MDEYVAGEEILLGDGLKLENGIAYRPTIKRFGPGMFDFELDEPLVGYAANPCQRGESVQVITKETVFDIEAAALAETEGDGIMRIVEVKHNA